jgi:uncharacterized membrane protein
VADIRNFFSPEDAGEILSAIVATESRTSGQVRVRVEHKAGKDPLANARAAFEAMGLKANAGRSGVMFYISVEDRKFAVLGDEGISAKVPEDFWKNIKDAVITKFKQKQYAIGLAGGIALAGEKLAEHFPREEGAPGDLPDGISYED